VEEQISADRDVDLWLLFDRTSHSILRARAKELALYDITPGQALILSIVHDFGSNVTLQNIADFIFREMHSTHEQVTRIEKRGFLKKIRRTPGTKRTRFILTEKGLKAYDAVMKHESIHIIMSVLSEEERKQLELCLEKLFTKSEKFSQLIRF
jgi:DNA-binding MarR family transcriptional regulator